MNNDMGSVPDSKTISQQTDVGLTDSTVFIIQKMFCGPQTIKLASFYGTHTYIIYT